MCRRKQVHESVAEERPRLHVVHSFTNPDRRRDCSTYTVQPAAEDRSQLTVPGTSRRERKQSTCTGVGKVRVTCRAEKTDSAKCTSASILVRVTYVSWRVAQTSPTHAHMSPASPLASAGPSPTAGPTHRHASPPPTETSQVGSHCRSHRAPTGGAISSLGVPSPPQRHGASQIRDVPTDQTCKTRTLH